MRKERIKIIRKDNQDRRKNLLAFMIKNYPKGIVDKQKEFAFSLSEERLDDYFSILNDMSKKKEKGEKKIKVF